MLRGAIVGAACVGLAGGFILGAIAGEPLARALRPIPPTPAVDPIAFRDLNRAATALEEALAIGVNFGEFSERLRQFATELSLAYEAARTEAEGDALKIYERALGAYKDSLDLWNRAIRSEEEYEIFIAPALVEKYNLGRYRNTPYPGKPYPDTPRYDIDGARQSMWLAASRAIAEARSAVARPANSAAPSR